MSNSHEDNHNIRWAIQTIAQKGIINPQTFKLKGVGYTVGYVVAVNDDNTIDVAEFGYSKNDWEFDGERYIGEGLHYGVKISPMSDNKEGYLLIPKIHSEVAICQGEGGEGEYVAMFSHLDRIKIDSHENLNISVREREEYKENDPDGDDIDELKLTGVKATTDYKKDTITSVVSWDKDDSKANATQIIGVGDDKKGIYQGVGDNSSLYINTDEITLEQNKSSVLLNENKSSLQHGNTAVTIKDKTVFIGKEDGVSNAVLGQELASFLTELIDCLCQTLTPTLMGTMPSTNIPQLTTLAAKVRTFQATLSNPAMPSGFLAKSVKIQK